MVMSKSKKVVLNLKLDAPHTYQALENLAEISQELVNSALDGDEQAIAQIADFKLKQATREANADQVFSNLKDGVTSLGNVFAKEADFINHTSKEVTQMADSWKQTRLSDRTLAHGLEQSLIRSDYELIEADVKHERKINLLGTEHKTNIRLIDVDFASKQHQLNANVNHALGSSPKAVQASHYLKSAKGAVQNIGSGLFGMVKRLFD
ncbi:hypothetical protein ACOWPH_21595 [Anabaena sp. PCC 7938]|uniref:Uncharacterized protein n=2 Tax=Nostocaceae TaxID=1162 RepID=K9ZR37_ANACC|nr:hypothetical protein [Anabaena sp. CCAP 1446/1C]AFZ60825.1 hypothetical protein Anacy_5513 [Anabaena cylindrica PCC 7122]MBY5280821.1 hypothetical protein [Anabaena sp. CCAP 1446/1C]MCM2406826.1 hypothetical protein [Anabaena sp. CCAP 1446/1C]BAY02082.1 hypothetical protein NIES19_13200 [Anabaena cylindrica PCC 7122]